MAQEWNNAGQEEAGEEERPSKRPVDDDARSAVTYNSSKSAVSKKSLRSQVLEAI